MSKSPAAMRFIFTTMFLDVLGIGLLIPILPELFRHFSSDPSFISHYYGFFISTYALIQFFASPVLGSLSDRFGRRPILLTSLLGAALDYLIMAFAPSLPILFLGRLVSGLTGASMTVASAYIADISTDENRSANFGMIGAAFGMGFVVGPALGGVIGAFGWQYPFLAASLLNLLNFGFGLYVLPESLPESMRRKIDFKKLNPLRSVIGILKPSLILPLVITYILLMLAGQVHPSTWTLYTQHKFGWSSSDVGLSLAFVGFSIGLVQGGLTRVLIPRIGEWQALVLGVVINVLGYGAFAFANSGWVMYLILAPSALSAISGPALQSLISRQIPPQEQGELQGTLMGLTSLTAIIGPLLFTSVFAGFSVKDSAHYFPGASYVTASLICIVAGFLLARSGSRSIAGAEPIRS